jgi:hypothetical protein
MVLPPRFATGGAAKIDSGSALVLANPILRGVGLQLVRGSRCPSFRRARAPAAALRPERKKAGVLIDAFLAGQRKKHGLDGEPGKG